MIVFKQHGNFNKTEKFLTNAEKAEYLQILEKYAKEGVNILANATPIDSGKTANSWGYKVYISKNVASINWTNSNIVSGIPIAIILQYGHGTRNGGYIQGRDYINPAIKPIFDKIVDELWGEVTRL
jgi:hypothetical protein